MFKMLNNRKGFTLVELIVVIVILGILAAIAVPSLIGYIGKANVASDISAASGLSNAATAYIIETQATDEEINDDLKVALTTGTDAAYSEEGWPVGKAVKGEMVATYDASTKVVTVTVGEGSDAETILPREDATGVYEIKDED